MMAASCKNLTFSSSGNSALSVLMASSFVVPETAPEVGQIYTIFISVTTA